MTPPRILWRIRRGYEDSEDESVCGIPLELRPNGNSSATMTASATDDANEVARTFRSTLVPRTLAWITVGGLTNTVNANEPGNEIHSSTAGTRVALLDGFTAACYTPPTLICGYGSIPPDMLQQLRSDGVCTVSVATDREPLDAFRRAEDPSNPMTPRSFALNALGLEAHVRQRHGYPSAIATSPVLMYCRLAQDVDLSAISEKAIGPGAGLLVLTVETFVVDGAVLSHPSESMKERNITAKIDAALIRPVLALNKGSIAPLSGICSMPRPRQQLNALDDSRAGASFTTATRSVSPGNWTSPPFLPVPPSSTNTSVLDPIAAETHEMEWSYQIHGGTCPLGFNATTALIQPRLIGWISTYQRDALHKGHDQRTAHVAPYSFFTDLPRMHPSRSSAFPLTGQSNASPPLVAFSGHRPGDRRRKDAQRDSEETGYFVCNMVTESLAIPMNLSAAEVEPGVSEFALAGLSTAPARTVIAPVVAASPVQYECEYLHTVDVGGFSVVIGRVCAVNVDPIVLTNGEVDAVKAKFITRLGYMDEYGIL